MTSVPPAGLSGSSPILTDLGQELGLPTRASAANGASGSVGDSAVLLLVLDTVAQDDSATQRGTITAASQSLRNQVDSAIASALAAQKLITQNLDLENNKIPAAQAQLKSDEQLYAQAKADHNTQDEKKYSEAVKADKANLSQLNGEVATNTQEIDSLQVSLAAQVGQLVETAAALSTVKPSHDASNQNLDALLGQFARIGKDLNDAVDAAGFQGVNQAVQETAIRDLKLSQFLEAAKKAKNALANLLGAPGKTLPASSLTADTNPDVRSRVIIPV